MHTCLAEFNSVVDPNSSREACVGAATFHLEGISPSGIIILCIFDNAIRKRRIHLNSYKDK